MNTDSEPLDIRIARRCFAEAIADSQFVPGSAKIAIRDEAAPGEAAAFSCNWSLAEMTPPAGAHAREITVQITAGAVQRFRQAEPGERGAMLVQFRRTFNTRLLDGRYDEKDASSPAFAVIIDEHCLKS